MSDTSVTSDPGSDRSPLRFTRILLKLSGEALGDGERQFAHERLAGLAQALHGVVQDGVQVAVVVGGGNIFRARSANLEVVDRVTADHVGMLATVMNAAILKDYLRAEGLPARVFTPREQPPIGQLFTRETALPLLQAGHVLIFAGGTGNPFFTTDSAAALRALEIGADVLVKGTQVDGVYDRDPRRHPDARRYDRLTYDEAVQRRLGVMDLTAITLCAERSLPILVFDIRQPDNLHRLLAGEPLGTWIEP
ncbi:MAG: UMP kinase [Candidatus Krumholzibacteriia bacterium]